MQLYELDPVCSIEMNCFLYLVLMYWHYNTITDNLHITFTGTYIPRKEAVVEETVRSTVIKPNQAIRLRARKECTDREGNARVTGEEWLVKKTGAYLPGAYEEVVDIVNAYVLTEKKALHMRSLRTFKDDFGVVRKNGEEWLITMDMTETHIPNVYEEVHFKSF